MCTFGGNDVDQQTILTLHGRPIPAIRTTTRAYQLTVTTNLTSMKTYRPCMQAAPYAEALITCPAFTFTG